MFLKVGGGSWRSALGIVSDSSCSLKTENWSLMCGLSAMTPLFFLFATTRLRDQMQYCCQVRAAQKCISLGKGRQSMEHFEAIIRGKLSMSAIIQWKPHPSIQHFNGDRWRLACLQSHSNGLTLFHWLPNWCNRRERELKNRFHREAGQHTLGRTLWLVTFSELL